MFNENQFIQWVFKYDNKTLFVIFCMRIAMCNQHSFIKESVLNEGLKTIEDRIHKKIKRWQEKQKLDTVSSEFYKTIEKTIRKTLSYQYSSDTISYLIKALIEIHIKNDNPQGMMHYIKEIADMVNSLLPNNKEAKEKFYQFWSPIKWYDCQFASLYYREQINRSRPMRLWTNILFGVILIAVILMLSKEISLPTGLCLSGGAVVINYLSRTIWRLTAVTQYKSFLSEEASQESHKILLDLIGLQRVSHIIQRKQNKNEIDEGIERIIDLVPSWHQEAIIYPERIQPSKIERNKTKPKTLTAKNSKKAITIAPTLAKAIDSTVIKWEQLSPPIVYDPKHPKINNIYPLYSSYFAHRAVFCRLNPALAESIPKKEFKHFQKVVERGRIIPSKSRGIQGIKSAFLEYRTVFGQSAYSDYKLKIARHNGQAFGHEVAATCIQAKNYILIDFDGYDPNAHETIYRKAKR